ncbi:CocE/NonD family hydrolase [Nocardioides endophyticus]|uniref:CocE/NonD family hydrolase n=1 Tax=Nocardioides endophyticus TaxID=1353775 RepID=A0ABP8Y6D7_9ACTN
MSTYEYRFRPPKMTPESRGGAKPNHRLGIEDGMVVERDVRVETRFGDGVYLDVYRPSSDEPAPVLVSWMPYGKHNPLPIQKIFPDSGVKDEWTSKHTAFESPDPVYWTQHGYAIVLIDLPGTWNSEGRATYCSPEEALAYYDLIEWAGVQPWSSGKVGLSGVSYLTTSQWFVAALKPPHLAAINPFEGWNDTYREVVRHGGIPSSWFWPYLWDRWGASRTEIEDLEAETAEHPFFDDFWRSKAAKLDEIETPAYVVASWTDQGLHTRGTLEGFKQISSRQKWLEVHGQKKWAYYYDPDSVERQRTFFDHFLKGADNELSSWPPVRVEVRSRIGESEIRTDQQWPLPETDYRFLYLDAAQGSLNWGPAAEVSTVAYDGAGSGPGSHRAEFEVVFDEATELVGHMKATLHMSAEKTTEMDVFVSVWKFDAAGQVVTFPFYGNFVDGPVALGWIRSSHRELDQEKSTPFQPVLAHQRLLDLEPDKPTRLEIEVLPSGTSFAAGDRLRLIIQGTDLNRYPKPKVFARHEDTVNEGMHVLHTGGQYDSHLLIPMVTRRSGDL